MVNGYGIDKEYTFKIMRPLGTEPLVEVTSGQTVEETYVQFNGRPVLVAVRENGVNGSAVRYGMVIGYPTGDIYCKDDTNNIRVIPVSERDREELSDIVRQDIGVRCVNFWR